ncbi:MAG: aldolase/citrate lyase family protein [Planctomycetota bacterium]|jgi:2-keto-3-deoxy-L-rhamnonate aldolase RhmA|nr:aldolase/citrate lyase family protein [Planctomycetota bacterium]MDP7130344.1 aldolase/citrate lyase family protein [Planctomycetota bacterium]
MPSKTLKQRIHDGEIVVGAVAGIQFERDTFAALLDHGPYDFVSTDSQHSAYSEERLVAFCEMADEFDIPVQFRIKHTRLAYLAGNCLDLGPSGIEVPQVELESTVDDAVEYFYYPPKGNRSWGGGARRGWNSKRERVEYANWWNESGVLWMQVESVAAVTQAHRLAKPGVDCLSFGPTDLTFSLESHPKPPFKDVDDCVRFVAEQLAGSPVAVCHRIGGPENREKYIDMGVTVLLESVSLP